jgi:hypothetical protein
MKNSHASRRLAQWSVPVLILALHACPTLRGDPIHVSSSATFTLDPDVSNLFDSVQSTKSPLDTPQATPPFDFDQTVTENLSQATGKGSVFHVETPTLCGLSFPGDTGVSQTNNGDFGDAATFTVDFTGTWTFDAQFGPPLDGFANFGMVGNVSASPGSYIRFQLTGNFSGDATRSPVTYDSGLITTPGAWADSLFDVEGMTPNFLSVGETATISGTMVFTAYASSGTSSVNLGQTSGMIPEPGAYALLAGLGAALAIGCRRGRRCSPVA